MKRSGLLRTLALMAALLLLLPSGAFAKSRGHEPLISIDLDAAMSQGDAFAQSAYYQARWLQAAAAVDGTQTVTLRLYLQDGSQPEAPGRLVYKRITHNVKERYQSPEIFLDYQGPDVVSYRVELTCGDGTVKSASFHRMLLYLNNNTACLRGLRFREIDSEKTDQWFSFRPINLSNVEDGTTLEIVGSNMYLLGHLVIHRNAKNQILFEIVDYDQLFPGEAAEPNGSQGENVSAPSPFPQNHEFDFSSVRLGVYHKLSEITDVSRSAISKEIKLGQWYDLSNRNWNTPVILYLNAQVSYNPNGLPRVDARQNEAALLRLLERFAY